MRFVAAIVCSLIPAITHAEPAAPESEHTRWRDPELALGAGLLGAGYAGALAWGAESAGNQSALYVPVFGPWLELFSLPDCGNRNVYCEHGNATRGVLVLSGAAQLVGIGFLVHGLVTHRDRDDKLLIAPSMTSGNPGVTLRGRF